MRLEAQPATSVAELADALKCIRPSVSRSLQKLKAASLVHRRDGVWQLTDNGKAETFMSATKLVKTTVKLEDVAKRTFGMWSELKHSQSLMRTAGEVMRAADAASILKPSIIDSLLNTTAALESIKLNFTPPVFPDCLPASYFEELTGDINRVVAETVKPLLAAQESNAALLAYLTTSTRFVEYEHVLKQTNLLLAGSVDNVLVLRQAQADALRLAESVTHSIDFSWVSAQLNAVSRSFAQVFSEKVEEIRLSNSIVPSPLLAARITASTTTVSHYTGSLRQLIEADHKSNVGSLPETRTEEFGDESLDNALRRIDPCLIVIRRGSWQVLNTGGLDRYRHAATSQRELLTQLLRLFVPDLELPEENRKGPQIKARIKVALGGSDSDADFVDTMVKAVFSYYQQLNKYTHENLNREESLRALMRAGEGLIRFILANIDPR
ncbi:MAG: hypothetical protein HY675_22750 [Chloroflexi bacterium]|nr:hypothetical protein [Chloroflexota bacterium]